MIVLHNKIISVTQNNNSFKQISRELLELMLILAVFFFPTSTYVQPQDPANFTIGIFLVLFPLFYFSIASSLGSYFSTKIASSFFSSVLAPVQPIRSTLPECPT